MKHHPTCPGSNGCTLTNDDNTASAEVARFRGWGPGTEIEGDNGYGPEHVLITAVGQRRVLAIKARTGIEDFFWFGGRCWGRCEKPDLSR